MLPPSISRPTNDELLLLLLLYGLFKQAAQGDNSPGMTSEQAIEEYMYIRVVKGLLAKYPSVAAAGSADIAPEGSSVAAMA